MESGERKTEKGTNFLEANKTTRVRVAIGTG